MPHIGHNTAASHNLSVTNNICHYYISLQGTEESLVIEV